LSPQHFAKPPVVNPQAKDAPADTEAKTPGGGEACPWLLSPVHTTWPLVLNTQWP
jgi:hypothetical protein